MPTSTYKSPLRPPNAPVFFALTPQFPLIWTAVIMDMSDGEPTRSNGAAAREGLRKNSTELFAEFSVRLAVIVGEIAVFGNTAYDFGWHEFTLTPKKAGKTIRKRHRYLELWKKNSSGDWKICFFINNVDVPEELLGQVSHWFLGEERSETGGGSMGS